MLADVLVIQGHGHQGGFLSLQGALHIVPDLLCAGRGLCPEFSLLSGNAVVQGVQLSPELLLLLVQLGFGEALAFQQCLQVILRVLRHGQKALSVFFRQNCPGLPLNLPQIFLQLLRVPGEAAGAAVPDFSLAHEAFQAFLHPGEGPVKIVVSLVIFGDHNAQGHVVQTELPQDIAHAVSDDHVVCREGYYVGQALGQVIVYGLIVDLKSGFEARHVHQHDVRYFPQEAVAEA